MSGMRGGQLEEMRNLARKFDNDGTQIHGLVQSLNSDTASSTSIWTGPAAERFRGDWESYRPTLNKLVESLHDAAKAVRVNADNIESATR
ncbi:MAG: WXG100 family type VII secretion target [Streptosporangiaceae bacterium]